MGTPGRSRPIRTTSGICFSLTLGGLLGKISCRSESASPARGFCVDLRGSSERQARVRRTYFPLSPHTSDIYIFLFFPPSGFLSLLLGRYLVGRVCVARTRLLRRSKMFSRRKAFLEALSRIVRAALISRQCGHFVILALTRTSVGCGKLCLSSFCFGCLSCSALAKSVPHLRLPFRTRAISNSASDSRRRAASFPLGSLARPPRADGTRPRMRLLLKNSAARPAGSRPRADAIRRAAERSRRAAERSCRTERPRSRALYADCDLSCLPTGVFSAPASGVFVRRPAASAGGLPASPRADPRPLGWRIPQLFFVLQRACLPLFQDPRSPVLR